MLIEYPAPEIGAVISGVDLATLRDSDWWQIYRTWLERNVIVVRDQQLSIEAFLGFGRRFGRVKPHRVRRTRHPDYPELTVMGVSAKDPPKGGDAVIASRGQNWHTDSAWDSEVCKATLLYGLEIPSYGGDTLFANMYSAYDALPERLKARLEGLAVEFAYGGRTREGIELLDPEDQARAPAVHPLVRVHPETGRKALYINPTHVLRIQGLSERENDELLPELYWYMMQPGAEYRHKWRVGDVVVWDNRCSIHRAAGGHPSNQRRVHWRTTVMEPLEQPAQVARGTAVA